MRVIHGAVLVGGSSRRMGVDKATLNIEGELLVDRVLAAVRTGGIDHVVTVGGTDGIAGSPAHSPVHSHHSLPHSLRRHIVDLWPGEGPLGAVVSAMHWAATQPAVAEGGSPTHICVVPVDLPGLIAGDVAKLLRAGRDLPSSSSLLVSVDGRLSLPSGLWSLQQRRALHEAFSGGERSLHGALRLMEWTEVAVGDGFKDVDNEQDLAQRGYSRPHE